MFKYLYVLPVWLYNLSGYVNPSDNVEAKLLCSIFAFIVIWPSKSELISPTYKQSTQ